MLGRNRRIEGEKGRRWREEEEGEEVEREREEDGTYDALCRLALRISHCTIQFIQQNNES